MVCIAHMAYSTPKTVWKSTAIPDDVHEYGKFVAITDKKPLGELLGDILRPVLKERYNAALKKAARNGGIQLKRQAAAINRKGRE